LCISRIQNKKKIFQALVKAITDPDQKTNGDQTTTQIRDNEIAD